MKALTVRNIDEALLRQVKSAVALSGKTMTQFVSEALRAALPANQRAKR